jgi:hypothetical protein
MYRQAQFIGAIITLGATIIFRSHHAHTHMSTTRPRRKCRDAQPAEARAKRGASAELPGAKRAVGDTEPRLQQLPAELLAALLQTWFTPVERRATLGATCRQMRELVDSLVSRVSFRMDAYVTSQLVSEKLVRLQRLRYCDLSAFCYQSYTAAERVARALAALPVLESLQLDPTVCGARAFPLRELGRLRSLAFRHSEFYQHRVVWKPSEINSAAISIAGDDTADRSQKSAVRSVTLTQTYTAGMTELLFVGVGFQCENDADCNGGRVQVRATGPHIHSDDDDGGGDDVDDDYVPVDDVDGDDHYFPADSSDNDDDGGGDADDNAVNLCTPHLASTRSSVHRSADLVTFVRIHTLLESVNSQHINGRRNTVPYALTMLGNSADELSLGESVLHTSLRREARDRHGENALLSGLDTDELRTLTTLHTLDVRDYSLATVPCTWWALTLSRNVGRTLRTLMAGQTLNPGQWVAFHGCAAEEQRLYERESNVLFSAPILTSLDALSLSITRHSQCTGTTYSLYDHMMYRGLRELHLRVDDRYYTMVVMLVRSATGGRGEELARWKYNHARWGTPLTPCLEVLDVETVRPPSAARILNTEWDAWIMIIGAAPLRRLRLRLHRRRDVLINVPTVLHSLHELDIDNNARLVVPVTGGGGGGGATTKTSCLLDAQLTSLRKLVVTASMYNTQFAPAHLPHLPQTLALHCDSVAPVFYLLYSPVLLGIRNRILSEEHCYAGAQMDAAKIHHYAARAIQHEPLSHHTQDSALAATLQQQHVVAAAAGAAGRLHVRLCNSQPTPLAMILLADANRLLPVLHSLAIYLPRLPFADAANTSGANFDADAVARDSANFCAHALRFTVAAAHCNLRRLDISGVAWSLCVSVNDGARNLLALIEHICSGGSRTGLAVDARLALRRVRVHRADYAALMQCAFTAEWVVRIASHYGVEVLPRPDNCDTFDLDDNE